MLEAGIKSRTTREIPWSTTKTNTPKPRNLAKPTTYHTPAAAKEVESATKKQEKK